MNEQGMFAPHTVISGGKRQRARVQGAKNGEERRPERRPEKRTEKRAGDSTGKSAGKRGRIFLRHFASAARAGFSDAKEEAERLAAQLRKKRACVGNDAACAERYAESGKAKRARSTALEKAKGIFERLLPCLAYCAAGYFLGGAALPFGLYPCGTALLCAAGKYAVFACLGASLRAIGYTEFSGAYFALNILALFVRAYLSRSRFSEPLKEKVLLSLGLSVTFGGIMAAAGGFQIEYLLRGGTYAVTLPLLTYCFSRLSYEKKSKNILSDCALCLSAGLLTYAAGSIALGKLFSSLIVAPIFVLAAACSGPLYGLLFGLLCGVSSGTLPFALALGAGGFAAGFTFGRKKTVMLPLFLLTFSSVTLATVPLSAYDAFLSALAGTVLYIPLCEYLPRLLPRLLVGRRTVAERASSGRMEGLSSTLTSVSDMLFNVSDKLRYPSEEEVREAVHAVCDRFCGACAMQENCYSKKLYDSAHVEDIVLARLGSGGLKITDLPEKYASSCLKLPELIVHLNDGYAELVSEKIKENKTEILASEYNAMARLIKYTSQKSDADKTPDKVLAEKVTAALCGIGVRFSSVDAYGTREKIIDVYGVCLTGFPCTAREIADFVGEKCGLLLTEPEFLGVGSKTTMRLRRARKLKLEYARSIGAKGENTVSGDSVSFFENDEDTFYALISDGMGSGRSAALTSRLTSVFVEKLLTTGAHKNVTLELLNDLLLSKSDESFATVDLLEIDLLTGEASFIKAGAAPAYILRAAKLYKIASCTPPAGIIRSFNAENTKFTLEPGDVVVMVSDGIVQSYDEVPWLCEMLSEKTAQDPAKLCSAVLSKAKKMNVRDDDMTCVAVRVEDGCSLRSQ